MSNFKFTADATPQTQVEVETLTTHGRIVRGPSRAVSQVGLSNELNEFQIEMRRTMSYPRSEISCLLGLLQPDRWMAGLWGDEKGGWHDARTNTFLSFDDARDLISARIKELGLSPELVHAWPHSVNGTAEDQTFHRQTFEQQMERFRQRESL
jgi:hypothetical protein